MKKITFSTILVLALVSSLYGCQQSNENRTDIDEQPLDRRIGVIKSLGGAKTSSAGTHLLQLDDGSTILLKSLQINLDDAEYLGKDVEVRGLVTYTTDGKQIMEAMNIDVIQQEGSQAVSEVSWKEYASSAFDFSIKYRSDFKIDETDISQVRFWIEVPPEAMSQQLTQETSETIETKPILHSFSVARSNLNGSLMAYLELTSDSSAELLSKGFAKSKIGAQSLDALKKTDGTKVTYYVENDGYVYILTIDSGSDTKTLSDQNIFYEMLSTFVISGGDESTSADADLLNNLEMGSTQQKKMENQETAEPDNDITEPVEEAIKFDATNSLETAPSSETQETLEGFATLSSDVFNFSLQYPKSWYYAGSAGLETGVVRRYDFGSKPLDEAPGSVTLDIMTTSMPSGTSLNLNGKTAAKSYSGSTLNIYVQGSGGRVYKVSGPKTEESTLLQMAGSIEG